MPLYQTPILNDSDLLWQVANGDEHAFKLLYDRYQPKVFHYVVAILKNSQIAEETVQDIFIKIWLGRRALTEIGNFNAWLYRVVYNQSISALRVLADSESSVEILWAVCSESELKADQTVIHKELYNILQEAIELLPKKRKEIYKLSREKGLTHSEIASHLGIAKQTVNIQVIDAQRFIRKYLSERVDIAVYILILACL